MKVSVIKKAESSKYKNLVLFSTHSESKGKKIIKISCDNKEILKHVDRDFQNKTYSSAIGSHTIYRHLDLGMFENVLVIGLGEKSNIKPESFRLAGGHLTKQLEQWKIDQAVVDFSKDTNFVRRPLHIAQAFVEGMALSHYMIEDHKSQPKPKIVLNIDIAHEKSSIFNKEVSAALAIAEATNYAKRLGDLPGNLMNPEILAKDVQKVTKGTKIKTTVWDKARIKKEKMGGLYGVSLGSGNDPRFIIMEYKGAAASKKPIFLVGKGLTFDSGGISIKPSASMDEMKYDMCGGANVIGAIMAIEKLKLKVNVTALIPSSENMPGSLATKPGDILTQRNGKTVEVLNTDAEGRLILADALSYASEQQPAVILDMATLTGAMVVSLGNIHTGVYSNDEKLVKKISAAAKISEEKLWNMPLVEHHTTDIQGVFGDLRNIGASRGAGSATAAAFLKEFIGEDIPWAHFDIAGTAWNAGDRLSYNPKKGATGSMVRTLVEFVKNF